MSKLTFEQIVESWARKSPTSPTPKREIEAPVSPPPKTQEIQKNPKTQEIQKKPKPKDLKVILPPPPPPPLPPVEVTPEPVEDPPERTYKGGVMKCGHYNWMVNDEEDELHRRAVEAGYCCHEFMKASESMKKRGTINKPYLNIRWEVKGLWHPIPQNVRRTLEKEASPGWPGLCSDPDTGLYIGGISNDCRQNKNATKKCVVHHFKPKKVLPSQDEEGEENGYTEEPTKIKKSKK